MFKKQFQQIINSLGLMQKAKDRQLTKEDWESISDSYKETYGVDFYEDMQQAKEKAGEADRLSKEHAQALEILNAMEGHPNRTDGAYCSVPVSHPVTLGEIVRLLRTFREQPQTLLLPEIPDGSFEKKLYSTYLSYLPPEKIAFPLKMNVDERGSFTELLKTKNCGQISVNITKPGITKGQHWHNSKWEFFMVVAGHGLIQERRIGSDEKIEFEVSGDQIQAVHMLPGYTHNIINLSETESLVTVMWANELFDPSRPDTYFEEV